MISTVFDVSLNSALQNLSNSFSQQIASSQATTPTGDGSLPTQVAKITALEEELHEVKKALRHVCQTVRQLKVSAMFL